MNAILPVNTLAGRGHNSDAAPLAEVLDEEIAPLRERAHALLDAAAKVRITTDTEASKAADLVALLRAHEAALDSARKARKRPFLDACRVIDSVFGTLIGDLARTRTGDEDQIGLVDMLCRWQRETDDAPIHPSIATIGQRREIEFVIDDLPAVIGWLLQYHGGAMAQAARTIVGAHLRAAGVDAAGEANIPGVVVTISKKTQVR